MVPTVFTHGLVTGTGRTKTHGLANVRQREGCLLLNGGKRRSSYTGRATLAASAMQKGLEQRTDVEGEFGWGNGAVRGGRGCSRPPGQASRPAATRC